MVFPIMQIKLNPGLRALAVASLSVAVLLTFIPITAVAQKVVVNGVSGEQMIMDESFFGAELYSMDEYYGPNADVMQDVINVAIERSPQDRFQWSKKNPFNSTANACELAAENMNTELVTRGTLPEGYDVRQIGTLGFLTTAENAAYNQYIDWGNPNEFNALDPPSYAHSLSVIKTPDGKYYTIDTWSSDIKTKQIYPLDADAMFFSDDPNETDINNSNYRLAGLNANGRRWDQTPKEYLDEKAEEQRKANEGKFKSHPPKTSEPVEVEVLTSADPNDKTGLLGVGEERFVTPDERVQYVIRFENMATASAPAQEVLVRDTLDATKLNLDSFELGDIAFGEQLVRVPPAQTSFSTRVPIADPFEVLVEASLARRTGIVTWRFTTIDTGTGDLPFDPLDGFLPPNNVSPEGEGSVSFSISMRDNLPNSAVVTNQARIIFDLNEPIDTPPWSNTIDLMPPASSVMQLTNVQRDSVFTVRWGGSDNQSGVRTYDVFASVDGGEFFRWLSGTRDTTGTWVGSNNSSYEFFSLATDATGNREAMKFDADASTDVLVSNEPDAVSEVPTEVSLEAAYPNPFTGSTNIGYSVVESGPVLLAVFDLQGREVRRLVNGESRSPGRYEVVLAADGLASGLYFYRLTTGGRSLVGKVILVR